MPRSTLSLLVVGLLVASPLAGQTGEVEEILAYDVAIEVQPGGAMVVTERIRVRSLGQQIRRGIYRDFPTSFPRVSGLGRIEAPFDVESVRRDGSPEPYALEAIGGELGRGGVRVRIGNANVLIGSGEHTYEIVYRTDRWLRYGDTEDQLYWNVTGNGWAFPIRSASADIRVAEASTAPRLESWTGPEGSTGNAATALWDADTRSARFQTDQALAPGHGLTVRATWPAGTLTPPSDAQREEWFAMDWGGYVEAGYLVLLVIAVYLLMWRRVGIDPLASPTTLHTEPPEGYSPAALSYIAERGYDQTQLASSLVSIALKGGLTIDQTDGVWTLRHTGSKPSDLSPEEGVLYRSLLGSRREIELKQSNHSTLRSAIGAFRRSLSRRLEREYFVNNRRWFAAGLAVSLVGFALLAWRWRFGINPAALFLGFWLSMWTVGVATLAYRLAGRSCGPRPASSACLPSPSSAPRSRCPSCSPRWSHRTSSSPPSPWESPTSPSTISSSDLPSRVEAFSITSRAFAPTSERRTTVDSMATSGGASSRCISPSPSRSASRSGGRRRSRTCSLRRSSTAHGSIPHRGIRTTTIPPRIGRATSRRRSDRGFRAPCRLRPRHRRLVAAVALRAAARQVEAAAVGVEAAGRGRHAPAGTLPCQSPRSTSWMARSRIRARLRDPK